MPALALYELPAAGERPPHGEDMHRGDAVKLSPYPAAAKDGAGRHEHSAAEPDPALFRALHAAVKVLDHQNEERDEHRKPEFPATAGRQGIDIGRNVHEKRRVLFLL